MAIVNINSATDTIGSQLTKINNSFAEIPVSGSYSSGTITMLKFGGGNFTITGLNTSSGSTPFTLTYQELWKSGNGSGSMIPTGYTTSTVTGTNSTLAGGSGTMSITGNSSFIGAGFQNVIGSTTSAIGAGSFNNVNATSSGIFVGVSNQIFAGSGFGNAILAGTNNNISANAINSSILTGSANTIDSNISNSSILAGVNITNSLSNVAMAAGFAIPSGTSQGRLFIARGTNSISGKDTLGGGATKTVSTTKAESSSIIMLTPQSVLLGSLYIDSISDGVSFTVKSTNVADTCSFGWLIISDIVA